MGVVEIQVQGHDQARQKRHGPAGGLVAGAGRNEPTSAQEHGVAQPQGHGHDDPVLEDSQSRQPDDQSQHEQGPAQRQQPLDAAGIEEDLPNRPSGRRAAGRLRWFGRGGRIGVCIGRHPFYKFICTRCRAAGRGVAGRLAAEYLGCQGLGLFFQVRAKGRDPPSSVLKTGMGAGQRHATGLAVRPDRRAGVRPVAQLPHLGAIDRHAACWALARQTGQFRIAPPATVARRQPDARGKRLALAGRQFQPFAKLLVAFQNAQDMGVADQAVSLPIAEAVMHELAGRQQVLPRCRRMAGFAVPACRGHALTANRTHRTGGRSRHATPPH